MRKLALAFVLVQCVVGEVCAQSLTPLTTFGTNGWRAPGVVLSGDTAGTANAGVYNYLGTGSLERGIGYNPVTGNLILVSRSAANGIRILNGQTGVDVGALPQGTGIIAGGTFTTNMTGVGSDGAIYVANLSTDVNSATATTRLRVYRWETEAATAPTIAFDRVAIPGFNNIQSTPRAGDSMAITGGGATVQLAFGIANANGYASLTSADAGLTFTATAVSPASTSTYGAGDFRLGITYGPNGEVWGKQTGSSNFVERIDSSGSRIGSITNPSTSDAPMDFATQVIDGVPRSFLATLHTGNSRVTVYDVTDPANVFQVAQATTTTGTPSANGNATGQVKFGAFDVGTNTMTIYAMSTNQGIQAFVFNPVPEPALILTSTVSILLGAWQLRRRLL
jgi:hypothetical protein